MNAGEPYRRNDPRLMSSLETAATEVRRPGPAELTWNWRWELGLLAAWPRRPGSSRARPGCLDWL